MFWDKIDFVFLYMYMEIRCGDFIINIDLMLEV